MSKRNRNLLIILVVIAIYVVIAYILFLIEKDVEGSNIKSFGDALWYSIITLTTIGYGDRFPLSALGRIISMFFVLGSIGILGYVISQISLKINKFMEDRKLGYHGTKMQDHVILINWNSFARQILSEIVNAEKTAVVITSKKEDVDFIYDHYDTKFVFVLHSEVLDSSTFTRANFSQANTVLLNFDDDTENLVNLIAIKTPFPDLRYVISLNNPSLKKTFKQLGVTFTLAKNEVASKLIASYVFEPEVAKVTENLMSSATSDEDMGMMQFKITSTNPYLNYKGLDLFLELKTKFNVILVGMSKYNATDSILIKNPTNEHTLELDNYAILMGNTKGKEAISASFGIEEGI